MGDANEYPEIADIETSSEGYASRFSGPAGEWMLKIQEKTVLAWIKDLGDDVSVLDVGGGHGQLAIPIAASGIDIMVLGSSDKCADRIRAQVDAGEIDFETGNVIDMAYVEGAFDVVISIRLLSHCEKWKELIAELCRVAGRNVIVDYPTHQSLNCFSGLLFGLKKKAEGNTRPYRLFGNGQIKREFLKHGFMLSARKKQFFLPMVLHRKLNKPGVSDTLERICEALGLTSLWGSPVLARFERVKKEEAS